MPFEQTNIRPPLPFIWHLPHQAEKLQSTGILYRPEAFLVHLAFRQSILPIGGLLLRRDEFLRGQGFGVLDDIAAITSSEEEMDSEGPLEGWEEDAASDLGMVAD